jgi:hypothetical protein
MILVLEIALGVALGLVIFHHWKRVLAALPWAGVLAGIGYSGYWIWTRDWPHVNWKTDWLEVAMLMVTILLILWSRNKDWWSKELKSPSQRTSPSLFYSACRSTGHTVRQILSMAGRKRKPSST